MTTPRITENPAGLVVVALGGTGGIVANHLHAAFGGPPGLDSAGLQLLYIDNIADDPRVRVGSSGTGVDTGPASRSFISSNEDPTPVLDRIAASTRPLAGWPAVTPAEADAARRSPLSPGGGFGGYRLLSDIGATLAMPKMMAVVTDAVRVARTQVAAGQNPTVVVLASGAGGVGSGHLLPLLTAIRQEFGRNVNVWVVMVSADPYEHLLSGAERGDMWARAIATQRELDLLPLGTVDFCYLIGGGPPPYRAAPAAIGVLASVAMVLETTVRHHGVIEANVPNWMYQYFSDAPRTERHSTFGAATVDYPADRWARLVAYQVGAEAWDSLTRLGDDAREKAAADARTMGESLAPCGRAVRVATAPPHDEAAAARPDPAAVEALLEGLSSDPAVLRPPVTVALEASGGRLTRLRADDAVAGCVAEVDAASSEVTAYLAQARRQARTALRELLRARFETELQGAGGARVLGPDPAVVARVAHVFAELERYLTVGADRLDASVAAVVAAGDPVQAAQEEVNAAGVALPATFSARSQLWADYRQAMEKLAQCRRWKAATVGATEMWRDLASMVVMAARPVRAFVDLARSNAAAGRRLAADEEAALRELHSRPSTRIVPAPGSPAAVALADNARRSMGDTGAVRWVLDEVRCQPRCPAPSPEEDWNLVLATPEVPGYVPARSWAVMSANSASGQEEIKDLTPGLFAAQAAQRLRPFCADQPLVDILGLELAHNWAPERGGVLDNANVESYLKSVLDQLTAAAEPHHAVAADAIDGRRLRPPAPPDVLVFADLRPALSPAGERVGAALGPATGGAHPSNTPGRLTRLTFRHRVSTSHLRVVQDHLVDYHATRQLVHMLWAARRASELEREATEVYDLPRRLLDPDVVALLADEPTFKAAVGLLVLDKFEREPLEPGGRPHFVVRVERAGQRNVIDLGLVEDPAGALAAVLGGPHAAKIRPIVQERWVEVREKLIADLGPEEAETELKVAARDLSLPFSPKIDVADLGLVVRLLMAA